LSQSASSNIIRNPTNSVDITAIKYTKEQAKLPELVSHDPIEIVGDDDFISQGWPGNGTWGNPFIIEGVNITTNEQPAIMVVNVTSPFVIRNSLLQRQSEDIAHSVVQWQTVSNGQILNCTITGNGQGIYAGACSHIRVMESHITGTNEGLNLEGGFNVSITDNVLSESILHAIRLVWVTDVRVQTNLFEANYIGVDSYIAIDSLISDNSFINCDKGIFLFPGGDGLVIRANHFENDTVGIAAATLEVLHQAHTLAESRSRIFLTIADNLFDRCDKGFEGIFGVSALVLNNTILGCGDGLDIWLTVHNQIVNNTVRNSSRYGIHIADSSENIIYGNIIMNSGISNARADGGPDPYELDTWDNGRNLGNYWSDYNGSETYEISGSAGCFDRWPRRAGPPFIWIQNETEVVHGDTIVWIAYDDNPLSYEILRNGSLVGSETWDGSDITYNVENLEIGIYNFTAVVSNVNNERSSAFTLVNLTLSLVQYSLVTIVLAAATVVVGISVVVVYILYHRREMNMETRWS
jgi:parallel beta-helix repeat protein